MIKLSLFILIMIIAIGIHYYIFYYKPAHTNTISETLSNMCTTPLHKKNVVKKIDEITNYEIETDSKNVIENSNDRPKINLLDIDMHPHQNRNKQPTIHNIIPSKNEIKSNVRQSMTLCTYTPSNDFVDQNDRPFEPGGSNQTMDYMSSKFLNDNLYQASFFTFSPIKNRIVYTNRPTIHTHSS